MGFKKIKKYLAVMLCMALVLALVACGKKPGTPGTEPEETDAVRINNKYSGYTVSLPVGSILDTTCEPEFSKVYGSGFVLTISRERSPYLTVTEEMTDGLKAYVPWFEYSDGVDQYIGYYQSRFLLNENWQKNNRVSVTRTESFKAGGKDAVIYHADIEDMPDDKFDGYSYIFIKIGGREYLRIVAVYQKENSEFRSALTGMFSDIEFSSRKKAPGAVHHAPVIPDGWSEETLAFYNELRNSDQLKWGIYTADIFGEGINETIPSLEEKLDYKFDAVLAYRHSVHEFPTEFMEKNRAEGRIVELTYQITDNNNEDLFAESALLNYYRGENLDKIREFARDAKAFGHPFLFRFCNEMNSDWTSYGGMANMSDPDIFISVWQTFYRIFEEEGVDNCIWVYNPHDRNAPPDNWNGALAYYPGDEFVQMIGITGYNNGTYYSKWGESWRSFTKIYDAIEKQYEDSFDAFPWIITEFASSSIGGNKAAWINEMFAKIGDYPNIKIAVWFSAADYDENGNVARPYWLDETEETLKAFRKGLEKYTRKE